MKNINNYFTIEKLMKNISEKNNGEEHSEVNNYFNIEKLMKNINNYFIIEKNNGEEHYREE